MTNYEKFSQKIQYSKNVINFRKIFTSVENKIFSHLLYLHENEGELFEVDVSRLIDALHVSRNSIKNTVMIFLDLSILKFVNFSYELNFEKLNEFLEATENKVKESRLIQEIRKVRASYRTPKKDTAASVEDLLRKAAKLSEDDSIKGAIEAIIQSISSDDLVLSGAGRKEAKGTASSPLKKETPKIDYEPAQRHEEAMKAIRKPTKSDLFDALGEDLDDSGGSVYNLTPGAEIGAKKSHTTKEIFAALKPVPEPGQTGYDHEPEGFRAFLELYRTRRPDLDYGSTKLNYTALLLKGCTPEYIYEKLSDAIKAAWLLDDENLINPNQLFHFNGVDVDYVRRVQNEYALQNKKLVKKIEDIEARDPEKFKIIKKWIFPK